MRCFQEKCLNQRGAIGKVLEKAGSGGDSEYSVCPPFTLSVWTAACQPAEPMYGRGVCWGAGVSKVRAEPGWAEPSWNGCRGESVSCLWGTQIFSEETETAGAGETQPDRTWKPRAAMTHDGHKRRKRSCLLLLLLLLLLPLLLPLSPLLAILLQKQDLCKKGGRDDTWITVATGWTLPPL